MPVALLTGTPHHLGPAAATVGRAGFDVMTWTAESSTAPAAGPFDCYVQLPCAGDGSPGHRAADDLVCRIDTLAAVAERLQPNASIVLAVDEADLSAGPQAGGLAPDLLAAVALALLEDLGRPTARLAVLPVAEMCRRASTPAALGALVAAGSQCEMPTPPLVSAP